MFVLVAAGAELAVGKSGEDFISGIAGCAWAAAGRFFARQEG
jgi:hypothetical protein